MHLRVLWNSELYIENYYEISNSLSSGSVMPSRQDLPLCFNSRLSLFINVHFSSLRSHNTCSTISRQALLCGSGKRLHSVVGCLRHAMTITPVIRFAPLVYGQRTRCLETFYLQKYLKSTMSRDTKMERIYEVISSECDCSQVHSR